jgi:hypothetical protein
MAKSKKVNIKFGIIGISNGNGHPYSWSAIFNGFNKSELDKTEYLNISNYLSLHNFPKDQIQEGKVTHVWTQDKNLSKQIANSCYIENICDDPDEMINKVDAILLARDDSENHYEFAENFISQGLPIFIDKPLSTNFIDASRLLAIQKYESQIFTCSSLRYANELQFSKEELDNIGKIKEINAFSPKSWEKYSIHLIEPISIIPNIDIFDYLTYKVKRNGDSVKLALNLKNGVKVNINTLGDVNSEIFIKITGEKGEITKYFKNSFNSFKNSLLIFMEQCKTKINIIPRTDTLNIIKLIELGI